MALNNVNIMGRLTADPELNTTQSNVSVTSFTLAVERDFKNSNGERGADFIDCVAWRNTAEFIAKYFGKGRMMIASGKLQTRSFEDKNGNKRKAVETVVEQAYFGDSKNNAGGNENATQSRTERNNDTFTSFTNKAESMGVDIEYASDDLPF